MLPSKPKQRRKSYQLIPLLAHLGFRRTMPLTIKNNVRKNAKQVSKTLHYLRYLIRYIIDLTSKYKYRFIQELFTKILKYVVCLHDELTMMMILGNCCNSFSQMYKHTISSLFTLEIQNTFHQGGGISKCHLEGKSKMRNKKKRKNRYEVESETN